MATHQRRSLPRRPARQVNVHTSKPDSEVVPFVVQGRPHPSQLALSLVLRKST
jgi:hypothetical protein